MKATDTRIIIDQIERFGHPTDDNNTNEPKISFTKKCPYSGLVGKTWVISEITGLADKGYEVNSQSRCSILSGILSNPKYKLKEGRDFVITYPQ